MMKKWIILAILLVCVLVGTVSAVPIKFATPCEVYVTYLSTDASYSSFFGWVQGAPPGTLHQLGQGHVTAENTIWDIGPRLANENNIMYITPAETGYTYYSDPPAANPDNIEHVQVTQIDQNGYIVKVGFEDLLGGGDKDYNDIYLEVTCRPISPPPVPEFPTMALPVAFIIGMLGVVLFIQKYKEN